MQSSRSDIRLALPSKGRLAQGALDFLASAGLRVRKPNPRQFEARIPTLPGLTVLFQRAGDIVVSVRDGSIDFGIAGWDAVSERTTPSDAILPLHQRLGFGHCTLNVIIPERWDDVNTMAQLARREARNEQPLRVATKYPQLTRRFLDRHDLAGAELIRAEGTLEVAPSIGYADIIVDLVSTGTTLRDNRLRQLDDGLILESQACLIANRGALRERPEVLAMVRQLLEFIEAHMRAASHLSLFVNMRGESPQVIAARMLQQEFIGGLQGPTISPVITQDDGDWHAVHIIVPKDRLSQAIGELRAIGGSGVVVTPVTYIFEEEPAAYQAMLAALD